MEKAVLRILDANFNRAREGLRVMEEYCRFVLNNSLLSEKSKQLRHRLCRSFAVFDSSSLIYARDSQNDVGKAIRFEGQMKKNSLEDCLTAAVRRLTEALRAIAEIGQTIDGLIYEEIEKLRFDVYTLEKEIVTFAYGILRFGRVRLYVLITVTNQQEQNNAITLARACIDGGADCLQLRCKGIPDREFLSLSEQFSECCRSSSVLSIINDRMDIAMISQSDGVHLGQHDISVANARTLQSRPMMIGISTHNTEQLYDALLHSIDYVGLGPVFPTKTKKNEPVAGLEYLSQAMDILKDKSIGHVAIGGITVSNIDHLLTLGVKTVAVCSEVMQSDNPTQICKLLREKIVGNNT